MEKLNNKAMENTNDLEKLKSEILAEVGMARTEKKTISWSSFAVYGALVVLTFFAIAQTVQSAIILNKVNSGGVKTINAAGTSNTPLPSNLNNLPNMVGGC